MAVKKIKKPVWVVGGEEFETERQARVYELEQAVGSLLSEHFEPDSDAEHEDDDYCSGDYAGADVVDFIVENRAKLGKLFDEADKLESVKKD